VERNANDVLCSVSTGIVGERSNEAYLSQRVRGHELRQCKSVTTCINGAVGPGNQRETRGENEGAETGDAKVINRKGVCHMC